MITHEELKKFGFEGRELTRSSREFRRVWEVKIRTELRRWGRRGGGELLTMPRKFVTSANTY